MNDEPKTELDALLDALVTELDYNAILNVLRHIGKVEYCKYVWKDGEYQGCTVIYANPLHPDLKIVFHPYIPLMIYGVDEPAREPPKITREYFIQHGWPVPGEDAIDE